MRSGRRNGGEARRVTVHVKEEKERDDGRVRLKQESFKLNVSVVRGRWGVEDDTMSVCFKEEEDRVEVVRLVRD